MADFQIANYETDAGDFRPIKVKSTTVTELNPQAETSGTGTFVRAQGKKRAYGTIARQINISRNIGTAEPYSSSSVSVSIPYFTKEAFENVSVGSEYTYEGLEDWFVTSKTSESNR
jgi:hypothetical protein